MYPAPNDFTYSVFLTLDARLSKSAFPSLLHQLNYLSRFSISPSVLIPTITDRSIQVA
jgi:hypothetical protein